MPTDPQDRRTSSGTEREPDVSHEEWAPVQVRLPGSDIDHTWFRCPRCGTPSLMGYCNSCNLVAAATAPTAPQEASEPITTFEAGFWAGRGDYRNVLEAWHAHTGQEPPTLEQYRAHYGYMTAEEAGVEASGTERGEGLDTVESEEAFREAWGDFVASKGSWANFSTPEYILGVIYRGSVGPLVAEIRRLRLVVPWKHAPGASELKMCPACGTEALEGETACSSCGLEPGDDMLWRDMRTLAAEVETLREENEDLKQRIFRLSGSPFERLNESEGDDG